MNCDNIQHTINLLPFETEHKEKKKPLQNQESSSLRFEFLDGYRGSLALIVTIAHSLGGSGCLFFQKLSKLPQKYAISGFFILSSFLLTYRLIKDLNRRKNPIFVTLTQYFIRRLFRVYFVFAIFVIGAKYGPRFIAGYTYGQYEPLLKVLSLNYVGLNHLWTIAPEIKFYFLIPIICLGFHASRRFEPIYVLAFLIWTTYDQQKNFFKLKANDIFSFSKDAHLIKNHFAVFLIGCEVAMVLHLLENCQLLMKIVKNIFIQALMSLTCLALAWYAIQFHTEIKNQAYDYRYRQVFINFLFIFCI